MRLRLFAALLCVVGSAVADELPATVSQALKAAQIPLERVAVVVQPVDAPAPLVAHNARRPMNPASVMKLLTTYAALDLLGPAHTWRTEALADLPPAADGRLAGNLYLKGSGDPKLALEHFWALLRQVRVRGVQTIAGDVVLDRSGFEAPVIDRAAFDDRPTRPYNVGPDALLVNFQSLRFSLQADRDKVRLLLETPSDGLRIDNKLRLTDTPCGSDWKDLISVRPSSDPGGDKIEFAGSFSLHCGDKTLNIAPFGGDAQVGGLFRALWKELGGKLGGVVRPGAAPPKAVVLVQHESPPLADIVRDINKFSNNVMARQLYLTLGGGGANAAALARQRIDEWLAARGLAFKELEIENGSGLSRREQISADSLNRLLLDAWKSPVMPELVASLPLVGIDGTMRRRLRETSASGRAHIKTGSIEGVRTAAGFALDGAGRRYAVTILINHPRAALGQSAIDALLLWIAQRPAVR